MIRTRVPANPEKLGSPQKDWHRIHARYDIDQPIARGIRRNHRSGLFARSQRTQNQRARAPMTGERFGRGILPESGPAAAICRDIPTQKIRIFRKNGRRLRKYVHPMYARIRRRKKTGYPQISLSGGNPHLRNYGKMRVAVLSVLQRFKRREYL